MCGIYGVTLDPGSDAPAAAAVDEVRAGVAVLAHRGPGERSVVPAGGVVLGTARLHVTSPRAPSGPYAHGAGGRIAVVATVNGEIWNHRELAAELRARGVRVPPGADTAVVAPLYAEFGVEGLARLRGMFGLALHDARTGCTVLARDRLGIKPLYYQAGPPLRFASESRALPGGGRRDHGALADYLALGFVPAPATLDAAVRKVPPGTALVFEPGRAAREVRFARPPTPTTDVAPRPDEIRAALATAVGRHLMGDAPVGVYLSGGVDSAAVAALVAAAGAPLRTFAMSFPGEGAYDEGDAAQRSADWLGAHHTRVAMSADDLPGLLWDAARHFGEPFGDPSALAVLALSRAAAHDVTVVLTGTGADELFLGYRRYSHGRPVPGAGALAAAAAGCLPRSRRTRVGTLGVLLGKYAASARGDPAERYLERLAVVPAAWRARLLGSTGPPPVVQRLRTSFSRADAFADGARLADLDVYLPDDLLAKEDRMTMACSLENRVPFLDDDVIDLAAGLTSAGHRRAGAGGPAGRGKRLLRRALRGVLPGEIAGRRKHGFAVPVSEWLRGPAAGLVEDLVLPGSARVRDLLDGDAVAALLHAHRRGDDSLGLAAHALLALEVSLRLERP